MNTNVPFSKLVSVESYFNSILVDDTFMYYTLMCIELLMMTYVMRVRNKLNHANLYGKLGYVVDQ